MASGSDYSDSLTPAPSLPVVARPPVASSFTLAPPAPDTAEPTIEPSSSEPDDRVKEDLNPNSAENQAPTTDPVTSPASVALEPSQRSTSVAISIDDAPNDLPPSSSTLIDAPQAPTDCLELPVPATPVRRVTVNSYTRRKKTDVGVSLTTQVSLAGFYEPESMN
jgi:hypothetical protein